MFKTISIIVISVSIFGLILFVFVKNLMKRRIEYYLKLNENEKITFIFSTHDQRVIDRARRVLTLEDGKIVSDKKK